MIARRSRLALFGALLAFAAMLGTSALSVWHSAMATDTDPVHAVSFDHVHIAAGDTDPDGPLHLVAHATGQFLSIASEPARSVLAGRMARVWTRLTVAFRNGSDPSGLLRPPRA